MTCNAFLGIYQSKCDRFVSAEFIADELSAVQRGKNLGVASDGRDRIALSINRYIIWQNARPTGPSGLQHVCVALD
jgi:hypothetical protein